MASRSAWIGFWVVVLAVGILFWWYMTSGGVQREEEAIQFDGLPEAEVKKLREKAEKHQFQPEVSSLLKEIAGTPHPRQKIFLQSLLWNAATALDKIRLLSLSDPYELSTNSELTIRITVDSEHRKLTIRDTGVGLTRQDLVTLGGDPNQWWLPRMWKAVKNFCGVVTPVRDLIGLFGVRFYSAFAVADRVIVKTKHNGDEQYVMLVSSSGFFIAEDPRGDTLERGTEITLHIKKEAHNFLEPDTIEKLVQKYSQFINVEISLWQLKTITVEEPVEAKEGEGKEEAKPKTKSVEKTFWDQMQVKSFDRDSDMFELKLLALMYSKLQIIDSNTGSWLGFLPVILLGTVIAKFCDMAYGSSGVIGLKLMELPFLPAFFPLRAQQYRLCVPPLHKEAYLVHVLNEKAGNSVIIFCATCASVMKTAFMLRHLGFTSIALHGDMNQLERNRALDQFRNSRSPVLVCTDGASGGLDIPNVNIAVNFDVPNNSQEYRRQVGRTARAGKSGISITIVTQYDMEVYQRVEANLGYVLPEYPAPKEDVMPLVEHVLQAKRQAAQKYK